MGKGLEEIERNVTNGSYFISTWISTLNILSQQMGKGLEESERNAMNNLD
jgi:hypothetical protein